MPEPAAIQYHQALLNVLCTSATPGVATYEEWRRECVQRELVDDWVGDAKKDEASRGLFKKYRRMLVENGWIACDSQKRTVRNLRKS
jgi:hypothetical protein